MRIESVDLRNEGFGFMVTSGEGATYQQPWTRAKLRKPSECERCRDPIAKGEHAWRPVTNQYNRMWRVCTPCVAKMNDGPTPQT